MTVSGDRLLPEERLPQRNILLEFGTAPGARVRGRLGLRGAHRVIDALNNWQDAIVPVTDVMLDDGSKAELAVVNRHEILWGRPLEPEVRGAESEFRVEKVGRTVIADIGPFRLRGTAYTFTTVRWLDFMIALAGQFFPLTNADIGLIAAPESISHVPFLAVNAGRVATLYVVGGSGAG